MSDPELSRIYEERIKKMLAQAGPEQASIVRLTTSNFDGYLGGGRPLFVDFWAVWCGPCRTMEPVVERLARKYAGRVVFGKLNVDEEPSLATRYDVQSIPTFMLFSRGSPSGVIVGAVGEQALEKLLQKSASA